MHGLAQREGAITSHSRYQKKTFSNPRKNLQSPLISYGDADLFICFEPVEALRRGIFASSKTTFVLNTRTIPSVTVTADLERYPTLEEIKKTLLQYSEHVYFLNATELAINAFKNNLHLNIIMLGFAIASEKIPFIEIHHYEEVIRQWLSNPEDNIKALHLGLEKGKELIFKT